MYVMQFLFLEIGEVIAFLCSEKSSFVTGAAIEVTGGFGM